LFSVEVNFLKNNEFEKFGPACHPARSLLEIKIA
jgi:hypothetical protein